MSLAACMCVFLFSFSLLLLSTRGKCNCVLLLAIIQADWPHALFMASNMASLKLEVMVCSGSGRRGNYQPQKICAEVQYGHLCIHYVFTKCVILCACPCVSSVLGGIKAHFSVLCIKISWYFSPEAQSWVCDTAYWSCTRSMLTNRCNLLTAWRIN